MNKVIYKHYKSNETVVNTSLILIKLHPLMDFSHSFEGYDNLDGGRCLTVRGVITQREAAIGAVRKLGNLLLLKKLPYHLFCEYGLKKRKRRF